MRRIQSKFVKKLVTRFLPILLISGVFAFPAIIWAAASLTVTPSTGLANGQKVTVSGSGLHDNSIGSILECNNDPSQPTVVTEGNAVPISCSNPLTTLVTTSKTGTLPATSFVVHTGTIGPPATGKDTSGGSATTDAANYPCPPTAAQLAAGYSCDVTFGDENNDDVIQNITFASQSTTTTTTTTPTTTTTTPTTTTTTPTTTTTTPTTTTPTTTPTASTLTNTGPGNTIELFVGTVILASSIHYFYTVRRHKSTNQ
jgi:hypothetical protein